MTLYLFQAIEDAMKIIGERKQEEDITIKNLVSCDIM